MSALSWGPTVVFNQQCHPLPSLYREKKPVIKKKKKKTASGNLSFQVTGLCEAIATPEPNIEDNVCNSYRKTLLQICRLVRLTQRTKAARRGNPFRIHWNRSARRSIPLWWENSQHFGLQSFAVSATVVHGGIFFFILLLLRWKLFLKSILVHEKQILRALNCAWNGRVASKDRIWCLLKEKKKVPANREKKIY